MVNISTMDSAVQFLMEMEVAQQSKHAKVATGSLWSQRERE